MFGISSFEILKEKPKSPIPKGTPSLHTKYKDANFLSRGDTHYAIDIFVAPGTPVLAPETGLLCFKGGNPYNELIDIALLGNSGRLYLMLHLDPRFIHKSLESTYGVNFPPKDVITQGSEIARVGVWPSRTHEEDKLLLTSVNSNGSHLHLAVFEGPFTMEQIGSNFPEITKSENGTDPSKLIDIEGKVISTPR